LGGVFVGGERILEVLRHAAERGRRKEITVKFFFDAYSVSWSLFGGMGAERASGAKTNCPLQIRPFPLQSSSSPPVFLYFAWGLIFWKSV